MFCRLRDPQVRRLGGWLAWPTLESATGCGIWAWRGDSGQGRLGHWAGVGLLLMAPRGLGPTGTGTISARETRHPPPSPRFPTEASLPAPPGKAAGPPLPAPPAGSHSTASSPPTALPSPPGGQAAPETGPGEGFGHLRVSLCCF